MRETGRRFYYTHGSRRGSVGTSLYHGFLGKGWVRLVKELRAGQLRLKGVPLEILFTVTVRAHGLG